MSHATRSGVPSVAECHEAVVQALEARRAAYRAMLDAGPLTPAALREQLTGLPLPEAERDLDGWWRVGTIVDAIQDTEFDVWYQPPAPRRLAVSERVWPRLRGAGPPAFAPDGLLTLYRRRWGEEPNA